MIDLQTSYLGLTLKSPIIASSSPLCERIENLCAMEDAGAGAVVLHSLFEEQLHHEALHLHHYASGSAESHLEAESYLPEVPGFAMDENRYLDHILQAKNALKIPVIASLNASSPGGWTRFAKRMEDAGADAIELNMYYLAADPELPGREVESRYLQMVGRVREEVKIPIAVKLSPFFSSPAHMAKKLAEAGANGLVLFNRFYQPDIDVENLAVVPHLKLSTSEELRLRLRWVSLLFTRVHADLAITGGVHTTEDVLKCLMAGANVAMMTSALLINGIGHIAQTIRELYDWLDAHEYMSVDQMRGSLSQKRVANPGDIERANYLKVLSSYALAVR